jgi:Ca2+-binding RTX toxin-like protein
MTTENANWIQWKAADGGNGHWYTVVHDPVSWTQARDAAASLGPATYLATITSAAENAFIQDQLLGGDAAPAIAWLGGFQAHGFYGTYELEDWSKSDIVGGTTSIGPASGASDTAEFSYKVEIGPSDIGVPYRTAEFSTIAEKSGTVSFDYEYDIFHSWYDVNADFVLFSGTGAQEKTVPFVDYHNLEYTGPQSFSGTASIDVQEGQPFGFRIGGDNYDLSGILDGTLHISNFSAPLKDPASVGWQWVTGEPFTYTSWAPGEPNDAHGWPEDFLLMDPKGSVAGEWNDAVNAEPWVTGYVVESASNPIGSQLRIQVAFGEAGSPTQWYLPGTDPSTLPHPAEGTPVADALLWHFDEPSGGWHDAQLLDHVSATSWQENDRTHYAFENQGAWGSSKNIALAADTDTDLSVSNFVHVDINAVGASDTDHDGSSIRVDGAKRGNIVTGEDNDRVNVTPMTNGPGWSNEFRIATGAGSDTVHLYTNPNGTDAVFDGGPLIVDGHLTTCYIDLGGGNDFVYAAGSRDLIEGGAGPRDTVFYSASREGVTAYLNEAGATDPRVSRGGDAEGDVLTGIERLVGSTFDDQLFGDGGDNELLGRQGNDVMTGGGGADHYLFGRQNGTDTITDFTPWGSPPECEGSEICIALAVPLDRIVLKGGTQADIEAAVAGVTADSGGDAVVHYGETDIVLTGIQAGEVAADWFRLG